MVKINTNKQTQTVVAHKSLASSADLLYTLEQRIKLMRNMSIARAVGKNISYVLPKRAYPQGILLYNGKNGGREE